MASVLRIMQANKLTLERHTGRRPGRTHDGVVIALRSNIRWCSDHFELACRNGVRFLRISSGHAALNAVYLGLARVRTAGLMALPPLRAPIFLSHSCVSNALAADDKACSQQERTNETLSEKLDQTAGVICPPDIDPAIKVPTPNAGKTPVIPPPGSPGGDQNVQPK